jgi:uncharacterized protein (TIGR02444 family)
VTDSGSFPANPFWDYSLGVYAKPGVAKACIELQDEFGLDVNILLACLWFGATGSGRLESDLIRECLVHSRDWQDKVVQPLRTVRRYSKHEPVELSGSLRTVFRSRLQAVELDAEHVEQLQIAAVLQPYIDKRGQLTGAALRDDKRAGSDAMQSLLALFALQGVEIEPRITERLGLIVQSAFPGAA